MPKTKLPSPAEEWREEFEKKYAKFFDNPCDFLRACKFIEKALAKKEEELTKLYQKRCKRCGVQYFDTIDVVSPCHCMEKSYTRHLF